MQFSPGKTAEPQHSPYLTALTTSTRACRLHPANKRGCRGRGWSALKGRAEEECDVHTDRERGRSLRMNPDRNGNSESSVGFVGRKPANVIQLTR